MTVPFDERNGAGLGDIPPINKLIVRSACQPHIMQRVYRALYRQRLEQEQHRLEQLHNSGHRWHTIGVITFCGFVTFLAVNLLLGPETVSWQAHLLIAGGAALILGCATLLIQMIRGHGAKRRQSAAAPVPTPGSATSLGEKKALRQASF